MVGVTVAHAVILGTGALKPPRKGNVDSKQVTLTVVIDVNDNRHRLTYSRPVGGSSLCHHMF
jgi:hypothetical protein